MQVRELSGSRPATADSTMSRLESMPEFFEAEAALAISASSSRRGSASGSASQAGSRPGSAEMRDWNRSRWAGAAAGAVWSQGRAQGHDVQPGHLYQEEAGMPRPLPIVERASPTLEAWIQQQRDQVLTTRSRVEGVRSVAGGDTWYTLDVQCADLPANAAEAEFRLGAKSLPPMSVEAELQLACSGLPSLDEQKFELNLSCAGLPAMDDGRYRLELECNRLPPVADPRFELYFRSSDLRAPQDAQRRDLLLVLQTVPEAEGEQAVELGRTDVAVPPGDRRAPVAFEESITVTWDAEGQKLQLDAYFTSRELSDANNGRPLDLILDCELAASHVFKVQKLAEEETGVVKLRMHPVAGGAAVQSSSFGNNGPAGAVVVSVNAEEEVNGCAVALVSHVGANNVLAEIGRTEVSSASANPRFDTAVFFSAPEVEGVDPGMELLQFDVYHAPVHAVNRPGDAIDVTRGCAYLGSSRCRLHELLGPQAEAFELIDERAHHPRKNRLRTVARDGSVLTARASKAPSGQGAPIVVVSTVENDVHAELVTVQGRTEAVSATPSPKFKSTAEVVSKFRRPQMVRFDIYYLLDPVAAGVKAPSEEELLAELQEALEARGLPPDGTWKDVKKFDKQLQKSETKKERKARKKREKEEKEAIKAKQGDLNIRRDCDYVGSAECWLGALVQSMDSDDKQMELRILNKKDDVLAKKLRTGKSTVTVKAVAETLTIGEPIVVAYKTSGDNHFDDDEPPREEEVGRTEVSKPTANPKFKDKLLARWEYEPTDRLIFRLYYFEDEPETPTADPADASAGDGASETAESSSSSSDSSDASAAPPNGQYIGSARCTYKDLMEKCADGGLSLTIGNEISDMLQYRLKGASLSIKCKPKALQVQYGLPVVIVSTNQASQAKFEEVGRTELDESRQVDVMFEEPMPLEVEFGGSYQPKIRFDLVYVEEDEEDGVADEDDITCDPERNIFDNCTYVGSAIFDFEALFSASDLQLQLKNRHSDLWDNRLEALRTQLVVTPSDIYWSLGSPLVVASGLEVPGKHDVTGESMWIPKKWELGRTEVCPQSKHATFAARIPVSCGEEKRRLALQFDVYFVNDDARAKPTLEIQLAEDCQHIASSQLEMKHLLAGQNDLNSTRASGGVTVRLRNPNDGGLDSRLNALRSSIKLCAKRRLHRKAIVQFQFQAKGLINLDDNGKSDPFLTISRNRLKKTWTRSEIIYKTEFVLNDLNPKWREFTVDVRDLCGGDLSGKIVLTVFDWDKDGGHDLIGFAEMTVTELYRVTQTEDCRIKLQHSIPAHQPGDLVCLKASLSTFGAVPGTPPIGKVYGKVELMVQRVKAGRKPVRKLKLDDLGVRIMDGEKIETTFVYTRILGMSALTSESFKISAMNSKDKEIAGEFHYEDESVKSEMIIAMIQARIDFLNTGEVPPSFERLLMNVTTGNLGWNIMNSILHCKVTHPADLIRSAAARRGIERDTRHDTAEQVVHVRFAKHVRALAPEKEKPLRRTTLNAWGRWPLKKHKGRSELPVSTERLPMPPMPSNDGATGLLRKERRKEALSIAEWLVSSCADSAVGFIEGREDAATMLADRALELAMLECREEMVYEIVQSLVDLSCSFGQSCTIATNAAMEHIISELEVAEVVDKLIDRVELDAHYVEMRVQSYVPPLATLALRAALIAGAEGTVHTILRNPVLLETLRDPSMLPFLTQLLMDANNHRALHVAPEPMKFDRFITLHEDEFGNLSGHQVLTARMLTVRVVEAKDLPSNDMVSQSDPYAVVSCGEDEFKTAVISDNNSPHWDEEFNFRCFGSGVVLCLHLYDHDVASKDDPMGMIEVDLDRIGRTEKLDEWFLLEPCAGCSVPKGEVRLAIHWTKLPEGTVMDSEHWHIEDIALERTTGQLSLTQRYGNGSYTHWQAKTAPMASVLTEGVWSGSIGGTFSAFRTPTGRSLTVRVIQARGLKKMDLTGAADPFAVVKCGPQQFRTEIEFDTRRPRWEKEFRFKIVPLSDTLVVELYDYDRASANDPMGQIVIPLAHIDPHEAGCTQWYPLVPMTGQDDPQGDVQLFIRCPYALSPRMLMVSLIAARHLPNVDVVASLNPYALIRVEHHTQQSKIVQADNDPKYNEHFEFDVVSPGANITVTMMHHNKVMHDSPLGQFVIPLSGLSPAGDGLDEWVRLKPMPGMPMPKGEVHVRAKWTYDLAEHEQPLADQIVAPPDDLFVKLMEEPDFEPDENARVFVVAIVDAKELKKMDRFGHNDVYVKLRLDYEPPPPDPESDNEDDHSEGDEKADGDPEPELEPEPEPEPTAIELESESVDKSNTNGEAGTGDAALAEADEAEKPNYKSKWKQTKTIVGGGEAPTWISDEFPDGAELIFVGQTKLVERIDVEVYDEDIGTDDLIGRGTLKLGSAEYDMDMPAVSEDWQIDEWIPLTGDKMKKVNKVKIPEPTGQLHLMGKWILPVPEPELPKQRLYITVYEAAELPKMDRFGENDIFVRIRTANQGKETSVAKGGGTEPKWNTGTGQVLGEKFILTVAHMPKEISFQVFDQDLTKAELIGRGMLSLENQSSDGEWTIDRWIDIMDKKNRATGKVKVGAKWEVPASRLNPGKPEEMRQLHITVFSASKLKKMDLIGDNDVYCSIRVSGKEKRTTTIIDGGSDCAWGGTAGETHTFKLLPECPTCVEIRCMDEDVGSADDVIGVGFLDFEEQPADKDWTIDKFVPLVDNKGKQFVPPSLVKIRASWKKPPPIRPGRLFVTCFEGRQLANRDGTHGKNDVYMEVRANKALKRTQTIHDGGANPIWEEGRGESFKFTLRDMPVSLEVTCMDEDIVGSDDLIGRATVILEALPRGHAWELDRWLLLRDAKGEEAGTLHCLFRWKPRALPDEKPVVPYHLSGVWHGVGMERRTNRPLAPPFLTQPPVAYMNALKMLLVAESVLCCQVVADALVKPENSAMFQLLFRFPAAAEYTDDADEEEFLQKAFFEVDTDRSGIIDREEFTELCLRLDETMTQQEIDDAILRVDTDGDEEITLDEFKAWWIREDVRSASSGATGLRMAAMKEQMRLLVGEASSGDAPGPGSRWKCVRKAPVQAGVDVYSEDIGFLELGEVIEAIDTVVMEAGQLRIFFYRGWVSTKPLDSLGTANYSEQDAQNMFDEIDDDFSGTLDEDEVKELCLRLGRKLTKKGLADAMAAMDTDGNGTVEWEEFNQWWQANVNMLVQTDEVPTSDPWTVAKMRHKRDAEEAQQVRRELHEDMESRRQQCAHTSRQLRSEKKILSDAEAALAAATRICEEHKAQYGLSEPQNLKKLQARVEELARAVDARQQLVQILQEQIELIQRGIENEEILEGLAKRTVELELDLAIAIRDDTPASEHTSQHETVFLDDTTADPIHEIDEDDDSDEEAELLPRVEDFTHFGLPERSPMWWGTYCKAVATILERYEEQCIVRLTKRNMLWMLSQLHLVTVTTVLTTKACLMAILRHRLIPFLVSMLDGKRRVWSGTDCKLVHTARAVDRNIVTSASEVLQALLKYDSIVLDEHQVARLITIGILPDSDPDLAGPVLALLTKILLTNMHEGIGRLITPRDGTTKAIILEFLTNHGEVLYILRTRLRSAAVEVGTDGAPRLGYIRFAMVELTCAIAAHRYYVYRMVKQELFQSCVDLFFWFPWHSVLHAVVATALVQAIKAASEEDRMDLLLSTRLVDRVCAVAKNMVTVAFRGSSPNYSGHIWRVCDTILSISFVDDAVTGLLKEHRDWQWLVSHDLLAANALNRGDWEMFQLVQNTAQTAAAGLFYEEASRRHFAYDIGAGYAATFNKGALFAEAHNTDDVVGWCPVSSREKRVLLPYDSIAADSLRNRQMIDRPPPEQLEENETSLAIDKTIVRQSQQDLALITEKDAAPVRYLHPTRRGMSYVRSMQMDALQASRAIEAAQEKATKFHKTSFLVAPLLKSRLEDELGASSSVWNKGRMGSRSALLGETLKYVRPLREDMVAFAAVAKQELAENKNQRHRRPHLLRVRVVAARQLPKMDRGSSDPFCIVYYGKENHKTAVMHHDLEPVWEPLWAEGRWEHEFRFRLPERVMMKMPLLVEMYDEDKMSKNDPMGKVELPLKDLFEKEFGGRFKDGTEHGWYPLRRMEGMQKPSGQLHLNIHCEWEQRPLKVEVLEARDLPAMDHSGTSDPYAKISCFDQNFQTQVVPKTLAPTWNESFELSVVDFHKAANIYVEVYDKDRIVHDDPMGRVIIPIDAVPGRSDPPGRLRWKAVAAGDVDPDIAAAEGAHEAWFPLTWLMMLNDAKDDTAAEEENQKNAVIHDAQEKLDASGVDPTAEDDDDAAGASWPPENADSRDADSDGDAGSDAEAEPVAPMMHTAARGEVKLRLTWLPTAEEHHIWDQKQKQAERHQAGTAGPPGSPPRRKLRDARQQLPKLCAALLHCVTEDDAAGVVGLLRAHSELLRFACAVPIGGVETKALAAELLSLSSRPDMATHPDAEVPCVATPLHIAARCGSSTVIDALLRCAEMELPPLPLLERRDPNGRTALHCAASVGSTVSAQVLLEWGANILSFDYSRKLAVDYAEAYARQGSCARFLLEVTTTVATDGKPYTIIEGRVFGNRNPKHGSGVAADDAGRITWDYKGSGIRGAKEVDQILAGEVDDDELDDQGANSPAAKRKHKGAGGDGTNAYFIPTPATVPYPINKGHGKKGKVQGAPEGTRPMFVDRAKDALGIGLSRTARGEDDQGGIGERVQSAVSAACDIQ